MPSFRDVIARLRADDKKLTPELRRARSKFKRFGKGVQRDLSRSFSKATGALKSAVGLGSIAGLAVVGKDVLDFEKKLKRLEIQAGKSQLNVDEFRKKIDKLSGATGQSRQALLDTAARFVSLTGDAQAAQQNLELFAQVATGTGSTLEDIAGAAVAVQKQFSDIKPDEMRQVFDLLITQGNKGSVEIKQVAAELGQLGGLFTAFGDKGITGLADLGAAFQTLQTEFGFDPAKARTGLNSFFTQLLKKRKQLKKATGVDVLTADGKQKGISQILDELSAKGVGVQELLAGLGEAKAARAGAVLVSPEGIKAFRAQQAAMTDATKGAGATLAQFEDFNNSASGRIQRSWEQVKNQIAGLFTPERIAKFATLMEKLVHVLEWVIDNIHALGAAWVAAKVTTFGVQFASAASGAVKLGGALGAAAKGFGVLQAAAIGFSIGTALDQWLGLSDAISDALVNMDKVDARADKAFLRERAEDLGGGTGAGAAITRAQIAGMGLTDKQRRSALTLAGEAERAGIVGPGGKINRDEARKVATAGLSPLEIAKRGGAKEMTDNLLTAIELGLAERAQARGRNFAGEVEAAGKGPPISVVVQGQFRMDQNGLVALENPKVKRDRRGVTQ